MKYKKRSTQDKKNPYMRDDFWLRGKFWRPNMGLVETEQYNRIIADCMASRNLGNLEPNINSKQL